MLKLPIVGLCALAGIHLLGIHLDLSEPDAAIYAEIAREMYDSGDWLSLTFRGEPFLDKPHLPFWLSAFSFTIFGVESYAYRLPSLLFSLLGVFYTYQLAKLLYNPKVGILAAAILLSSGHFVTSNTDVRAEGYLIGLSVFSFYYLVVYLQSRSWRDLLLVCIGAGLLLMTKGLFTLMPLFFGAVGSLLIKRKWQQLIDWRWLVGGVMTLLFASPVMLAYLLQFDLHPEQLISLGDRGEVTGVSGVKFFWWDSQFGRFFNTGPIRGDGNPWFYLYTILWAFFPWGLLWFVATFSCIRALCLKKKAEVYCLFASVPVIAIFSASQFQLPHYLNPLFPFFAIVVAAWLCSASEAWLARMGWIQWIILVPVLLLLPLFWWISKTPQSWILVGFVAAILLLVLVYRYNRGSIRIVGTGLVAASIVNLFTLGELFPWLTSYQAGSQIAHYIKQEGLAKKPIAVYGFKTEALDFYLEQVIPRVTRLEELPITKQQQGLLITKAAGVAELQQQGKAFRQIAKFDDFGITRFNRRFYNRKQRSQAVSPVYLLAVR